MRKQGMNISVNELRELADDLESQTRQFNLELGEEDTVDFDKRWQVNIINESEDSDGWRLE